MLQCGSQKEHKDQVDYSTSQGVLLKFFGVSFFLLPPSAHDDYFRVFLTSKSFPLCLQSNGFLMQKPAWNFLGLTAF